MNLLLNEAKALGACILNADKDPFGLTTDGKGKVTVAPGKNFMQRILDLPHKYVCLADYHHRSHEQIFDNATVQAMSNRGIKRVFVEENPEEYAFVEARVSDKPGEPGTQWENIATSRKNFRKQGITVVPSDPDTKKYENDSTKLLDKSVKSIDLSETLISVSYDVNGNISSSSRSLLASKAIMFDEVFPSLFKALDKEVKAAKISHGEDSPECRALFNKMYGLCNAYLSVSASFPNVNKDNKEISELIIALGNQFDQIDKLKNRLPIPRETKPETLLPLYAEALLNHAESMTEKAQTSLQNRDVINPEVVKCIQAHSKNDVKTAVQWGAGHFHGANDINEMLGKEKTIVIGTVQTPEERAEVLQRIVSGELADPPNYLYMPAHKGTNGQLIAEEAISVQEYLKAAKQIPQKAEEKSRRRN